MQIHPNERPRPPQAAQHADDVRVFLVWDTDSYGVSLHSIHATQQGAEAARRSFKDASWVEEREVHNDGTGP